MALKPKEDIGAEVHNLINSSV